ncbi:MAG: NINE protein [Acidovorax sp.]|nr:NINE protein [Acidovorax sp.]
MTDSLIPCHGCGKPLHVSAASCPHCGAFLKPSGHQPQFHTDCAMGVHHEAAKSKVIAGVLALSLGGIGIHKFYTGAGAGASCTSCCAGHTSRPWWHWWRAFATSRSNSRSSRRRPRA